MADRLLNVAGGDKVRAAVSLRMSMLMAINLKKVRRMTSGEHAAVVAFVLSALAMASLAFRPGQSVFGFPLTEDGYLLLTIARNFALGGGLTADGREATNGIQPLWTFLAAFWFWLANGDRVFAVKAILLMQTALFVAAAHVWARVITDFVRFSGQRVYLFFLLLFLTSHQLCMQYFNGLETGLLVFLFGASACVYLNHTSETLRSRLTLACLLGLIALTRIDACIFVACFATIHAVSLQRPLHARLREAALFALVPAAFVAPWFAYGLLSFGSMMPISGQALAVDNASSGTSRVYTMVGAIARDLFPTYWTELYRPLGLIVPAALFLYCAYRVALGMFNRRQVRGELRCRRRNVVLIAALSLYLFVLAGFYVIQSSAEYFWPRYMVLSSIIGLGVTAGLLSVLWTKARTLTMVSLVVLLLPWWPSVAAWHGVAAAERIYYPAVSYGNGPLMEQLALAQFHRRPGERIGAIQTGTLGFFIDGVFNLDGKVSYAALKARQAGRLLEYMDEQKIDLFVDFEIFSQPARHHYFDAAEFLRRFERIDPVEPSSDYQFAVFRRYFSPQ